MKLNVLLKPTIFSVVLLMNAVAMVDAAAPALGAAQPSSESPAPSSSSSQKFREAQSTPELKSSELKVPTITYYKLCDLKTRAQLERFISRPENSCYPDDARPDEPKVDNDVCFAQMRIDREHPEKTIPVFCPKDYVEVMSFGNELNDPNSNGFLTYFGDDTQTDIPDEAALEFYTENKYECGTYDEYSTEYSVTQDINGNWPVESGGQRSWASVSIFDRGSNCTEAGTSCYPKKPEPHLIQTNPAKVIPVNVGMRISAQGKLIEVRTIGRTYYCMQENGTLNKEQNDCSVGGGVPPAAGYWKGTFTFSGPQIVCKRRADYYPSRISNPKKYRVAPLGATPYTNTIKICSKKLKGYDRYSQKGDFRGYSKEEDEQGKCAEKYEK